MHMRQNRKKDLRRVCLGLFLIILCLIAAYFGMRRYETGKQEQARGEMTEGFGALPTLWFEGMEYVVRSGIEPILVLGLDKWVGDTETSFRDGGQADFLMLVIADHREREIRMLQIDRDLMCEVHTLGVFGQPGGLKKMQLCLAHAFGAEEKSRCENTILALENIFSGIGIRHYVSIAPEMLARFNTMLGGVSVYVEDDMREVDPSLKQGETVLLEGDLAEKYLRARILVGDGSNAARMKRQKAYMESALSILKSRLKADVNFAEALAETLSPYYCSDLSAQEILREFLPAENYTFLPIETLDGEYSMGEDGFVEFYPSEEATLRWVIENCYDLKW